MQNKFPIIDAVKKIRSKTIVFDSGAVRYETQQCHYENLQQMHIFTYCVLVPL